MCDCVCCVYVTCAYAGGLYVRVCVVLCSVCVLGACVCTCPHVNPPPSLVPRVDPSYAPAWRGLGDLLRDGVLVSLAAAGARAGAAAWAPAQAGLHQAAACYQVGVLGFRVLGLRWGWGGGLGSRDE